MRCGLRFGDVIKSVPQLEGVVLLVQLRVPNVVQEEHREHDEHVQADRADLHDYERLRAQLIHHLELTVTQSVQLKSCIVKLGVALALQFNLFHLVHLDGLERLSAFELALLAAILAVVDLGVRLAFWSEWCGALRPVRRLRQ